MNAPLPPALSKEAFRHLQDFMHRESGIRLPASKSSMVISRLGRRVQQLGLPDFDAYCALITSGFADEECEHVVNVLTTHETYFFREPTHFDHLVAHALPAITRRPLRVWCAASSSGEEAYSIAMCLANSLGSTGWEVLGSDISTQMLGMAARGLYPMERLHNMPAHLLKEYCLRGTDSYEGSMLVSPLLRERVRFTQHNLLDKPDGLGSFDVVFLRNVLIYFDDAGKRRIIDQVLQALRPGGWLYTGHAESLLGMGLPLDPVQPAVYRKPG
ncbi:MAG: protein-glutamate O-methyltransferase CheR [Rhodocyclaceae bacterium]